jgi:hypothetical protein
MFGPVSVLLDTTISVPVTIPRYSEAGPWTVANITLWDRVWNRSILNTAALSAGGFPTALTVIDANPDTQPPQIGAIMMSPNAVDVSSSPATITVDVRFVDAMSGFSVGNTTTLQDFEIRSPSGRQSRFLAIRQWQFVAGTVNDGVWRAAFNIPQYSEPGAWTIVALRTRDLAGNRRLFLPPDLSPLGASLNLAVTSSTSDLTPPQLTGLSFSHPFINTSLGPQTVQTDFSMTDDLSGAAFWPDTPWITLTIGAIFRSPSGAQSLATDSSFSNAPPISGTPQNGVWRFNALFPQFSEEGTWQVGVQLRDNVRNLLFLNAAKIGELGIPNSIVVIRASLQPDGTISNPAAGGAVSDSAFGSRAQLIVPGGVLLAATTIAIDVLQSPLGIPLPAGFSSAETYYVNVQLTPTPSFPLPAPGITAVLPLRNYTIPGTGINLFRIDPATGSLVPALDTSGNPIVGRVDAGGLTATFAGIARFSTIVGALPNAIPVQIDIKPGDTPNTLNLKSKGSVPVAIYSTPTLDLTHVDPGTIRFSGAPVAANKHGKWQIALADINGDGLDDLIAHFETQQILLGVSDTEGIVEGRTLDNRLFRGSDSVRVIK